MNPKLDLPSPEFIANHATVAAPIQDVDKLLHRKWNHTTETNRHFRYATDAERAQAKKDAHRRWRERRRQGSKLRERFDPRKNKR